MRLCERISYLYAFCLITVFFLFLPLGGYARMMEGKFVCFLLLSLGYILAMLLCGGLRSIDYRQGITPLALAYFAVTVLSALLSPYGSAVLLGGTRRDGLLTIALYVVSFVFLSRYLHADRQLIYAAAASMTLCDILTLIQLAGCNPLWLYPAGLNYYDGDIAYAGFYAGTAGNAGFTAFVLALGTAAIAMALLRGYSRLLALPLLLTLWVLWELRIAAALLGLAVTAVAALPLVFLRHRRAAWRGVAFCFAAAFLFVYAYSGANQTLCEASAMLHGTWDGSFGSGRAAIWLHLLPLIAERPLLGGGCGTLYLRGLPDMYWYRNGEAVPSVITSAHNEFLGILVDQGALALALYLLLIALALYRCYYTARAERSAICGAVLLCYCAQTLFSVSTCITVCYLWLILAILNEKKSPV